MFGGEPDITVETSLYQFPARPAAAPRASQIIPKALEGRNRQFCLRRSSAIEQRQHCAGSDPVFQA
jgi:hypothetical protein